MKTSCPLSDSCMVSFRCAEELKKQMTSFADSHSLTSSEVMRQALEQFMQQAEPCQADYSLEFIENVPAESHDATVATIARIENPLKRDARVHHHIAFLNRDEHDYLGFRFSISRRKLPLQLYFSPNDYGSRDSALVAALRVRDYVLEQLKLRPDEIQRIYEEAMRLKSPSPAFAG